MFLHIVLKFSIKLIGNCIIFVGIFSDIMKNWIIRFRLPIVLLFTGITLASLFLLPRLQVNPDLASYVPDGMGNKKYMKQLDSIFGGSEMVLVMMQAPDVVNHSTLSRLKVLKEELGNLDGIDRCISPFDAQDISIQDGYMIMDPLLDTIPESQEECELLKAKIADNSTASPFFAVDDFTVVSLMLMKNLEVSNELLIEKIDSVVHSHPGPEEVLMGGMPYIRYSINKNINKDLLVLLPVALLLMIIMLFTAFREWKGVLLPFIVVIMSLILSFGTMALLGWKISLITVLLPIMLIAIANNYGIHMIARYQELAQGDSQLTMLQMSKQIYADLKKPIILTGVTTIGGILGLLTHTLVPAAQIGILASIGIAFALMLSIWFLPAMLSYLKPTIRKKAIKKEKLMLASRLLNNTSRWVTNFPKRVIIISSLVSLLGMGGIFLVNVDTNIEGYFLGRSKVSRGIELINSKLGGSQYISILFSGDVLSPEILNRMDEYQKVLMEDPAVGNVSSPVTLVKELSKGFYDKNEEGYGEIPSTENEVYQFIEIFSMGGNEDAVEQFIDYNYENSRLLISLKDASNDEGKRLLAKMQEMTKDDPDVKFIAGPSLTKIELADMVIQGQIKSLSLAMVVVFVLLA